MTTKTTNDDDFDFDDDGDDDGYGGGDMSMVGVQHNFNVSSFFCVFWEKPKIFLYLAKAASQSKHQQQIEKKQQQQIAKIHKNIKNNHNKKTKMKMTN